MILSTLLLAWSCQDDLKALEKALQAAVAKGDAQEASKLARSAVDRGSSEHVKVVVAALPRAGLRVYWSLFEALRELKSEDGITSLTEEILRLKDKPEARDLVQLVLGSKPEKKDRLIEKLLGGSDDAVRTACVDAIVREERKAFIPNLIDLLEGNEKGAEKLKVGTALKNLTGLDLGPSAAWRRWWEREQNTFECPKLESPTNGGAETVIGWLKRNRRTQYEELTKGNKRRIAVVRGDNMDSDRVELVLEKLSIPHVLIQNKKVLDGDVKSDGAFAIFENCGVDEHGGKQLHQALRTFVEEGGFLFASDLSTQSLLWTAFPGHCKPMGGREREVVNICPAQGSLSDSLLRNVFSDRMFCSWKMHAGSALFTPLTGSVSVLIEAPELGVRPGTSAPLAGYFQHGSKGGRVAFVSSHFAMQEDKDGAFTLQNLLLNFLIEAQENFRARGGK